MKQKTILPIFFLMILSLSVFVSGAAYPSPFIVNNNSVDVAIIYGTTPGISMLEVVQAGNIQADLQTKSSVETGDALVKDYEIGDVSGYNLIILGTIGSDCSNSAFEEVLGKSCDNILSDSGIGPGQFLIQSVSNPFSSGKVALLIEGYEVADLVNAVSYLRNNPFETSVGSKYVSPSDSNETSCVEEWDCGSWSDCIDNKKTRVCEDENNCGTTKDKPITSKDCESQSTCSDTDGLDYYTKGKITWIYQQGTEKETYTYEDECESPTRIHEYVCDGDNYASKEFACPYGCEDGACKEQSLSDIVGRVELIYDDDYITSLDLIILGNLQTWLYEKEIKNVEIIKNSEINDDDLEDKISVFVYNRESVVIYPEEYDSSLSLVWAGNIQTHLHEIQGKQLLYVCPDLIKSSSVVSDDLKEYFCKDILNPTEDNLIDISNEETFICRGCKLESKCYPFGYRKNEKYCSDELEFTNQKIPESSCENSFECDSNLCINNQCVSGSLWAKFTRWLSRIFG